jgi:nucleoside-diphosphate-sugar epimerase
LRKCCRGKPGNLSVLEIAEIAMKNLENLKVRIANNPLPVEIEAENLNLNSSKALDLIGWKPKWSQIESVNKTFLWWEKYKFMPKNVKEICNQEIEIYLNS